MTLWEYEGKKPTLGKGTFVFPTADVIGDVVIGKECYIGPGARIRGDYGSIRIGNGTAVEENVVIHARPGEETLIGDNVTIGHGAIIHNATIEDHAVLGMGSIISDWSKVGTWAVVGEGALVKNKQEVLPETIVVGIPAREISEVNDDYKDQWTIFKKLYQELARYRYPMSLKRLE